MKRSGFWIELDSRFVGGSINKPLQFFVDAELVAEIRQTWKLSEDEIEKLARTGSISAMAEHVLTEAARSGQAQFVEVEPRVSVIIDSIADFAETLVLTVAAFLRPSLLRPPFGHRAHLLLDFLCSRRTMDEIVNQTIADIRQEEFEALKAGSVAKARWIHVRGYWSLFKALGDNVVNNNVVVKFLARVVVSAWKSAS